MHLELEFSLSFSPRPPAARLVLTVLSTLPLVVSFLNRKLPASALDLVRKCVIDGQPRRTVLRAVHAAHGVAGKSRIKALRSVFSQHLPPASHFEQPGGLFYWHLPPENTYSDGLYLSGIPR